LITAQEVTGLNPVKVTNKKKKSKNNQVLLDLFLDFLFFKAELCLDVTQQNPKAVKETKYLKMFRVFTFYTSPLVHFSPEPKIRE
jgi:hypothetical protein